MSHIASYTSLFRVHQEAEKPRALYLMQIHCHPIPIFSGDVVYTKHAAPYLMRLKPAFLCCFCLKKLSSIFCGTNAVSTLFIFNVDHSLAPGLHNWFRNPNQFFQSFPVCGLSPLQQMYKYKIQFLGSTKNIDLLKAGRQVEVLSILKQSWREW